MQFSHGSVVAICTGTIALLCNVGVFGQSPASPAFTPLRPGDVYRVTVTETLSGSLELPATASVPARKLTLAGKAHLDYRERPIATDSQGRITRTLRHYDRIEYTRRVGDQEQDAQLRAEVRRLVIDVNERVGKTYSPNGPLLAEEVEFVRTHTLVFLLEGFVGPHLASGQKWNAEPAAVAELAGLNKVDSGTVTCVYEGLGTDASRATARIAFAGSVTGTSAEGRSRNEIRGTLRIDPATGRMYEFQAGGTKIMLDSNDRPLGKVQVDYRVVVERIVSDNDLTDAAVAAVAAAPEERSLFYLFDHPGLGVRLLYPRHWRLASVRERELVLQCPGNSLAVHVEAAGATPTAAGYAQDVAAHFAKRKLDARPTVAAREASSPHGRIGHFRFEGTVDGQTTVLDYWVVARGTYGATLAARLAPLEAAERSKEIEAIARALAFREPLRPASP